MIPELPRNDPDFPERSETPLATSGWMSSTSIYAIHATSLTDEEHGSDILLGLVEDQDGKSYHIGYKDDRHIICCGGSRSGKGTALIISNLLRYLKNVVVIDPKGENAMKTAQYRSQFSQVVIFDPFQICDDDIAQYRASYNPLDSLDPNDPECIDDATGIADALIVRSKNTQDPHWEETARMVVRALILYVLIAPPEIETDTLHKPSLFDVLALLSQGVIDPEEEAEIHQCPDQDDVKKHLEEAPRSFQNLIKVMCQCPQFDGAISSVGHALAQVGDRELGSIYSTVSRNLDFLLSPAMKSCLSNTDFFPSDLRDPNKPTSVYLVLPEYRMATHSRWLRLMITTLMHSLQRDGVSMAGKPKTETLFILDEFASLGYLEVIERAASYIAGFGVKLFTILQDLNQLKDIYNRRWETFIGNCGAFISFANTDNTTLEYLSKRLGDAEIVKTEISKTIGGGRNTSKSGLGDTLKQFSSEQGTPESILGPTSHQDSSNSSITEAPKHQTTALMRADEIATYFARKPEDQRDQEMLLCLLAGQKPMRLRKCFYYLDDELKRRSEIK